MLLLMRWPPMTAGRAFSQGALQPLMSLAYTLVNGTPHQRAPVRALVHRSFSQ